MAILRSVCLTVVPTHPDLRRLYIRHKGDYRTLLVSRSLLQNRRRSLGGLFLTNLHIPTAIVSVFGLCGSYRRSWLDQYHTLLGVLELPYTARSGYHHKLIGVCTYPRRLEPLLSLL
ncbi:hypothetical protein DY000_02014651 [Brassica cretica]|uniref:Uncharacterized protein n=1 Tax=Brassica cretica TaxID=69181 RepID=A0ABQ7CUP9_BRACR|nr:hypothetical protein DY000_02014651 [Brassica cretica]